VRAIIAAANRIVGRPYLWAGGHSSWSSPGYDCSGTVSFALHGAALLDSPLDSTGFMSWGVRGSGRWVTIFATRGHVFMDVAGLRLDTSAAGDPGGRDGPRWRPLYRPTEHYVARHPAGL
jgi:hypothetical protein